MKLKVKVCGMREDKNILQVADCKPDYMGFIYYEHSPRFVGKDFQIPEMNSTIKKTGVFVNCPADFILKEADKNSLDVVQLHGEEPVELCHKIKSHGCQVIKAFSVDGNFDFEPLKDFQGATDFFLFDTKGKGYGGTGKTFDWDILNRYEYPTPFFLSGGLSPENVPGISAIRNPNLYGLDLNSGVEESPGLKNIDKIKRIFHLLSENNY